MRVSQQVVLSALIIAAIIGSAIIVSFDSHLRGDALRLALEPVIEKGNQDQQLVAKAILQNYHETRAIASLWSGLYWGFSWAAAVLGALAGLILKLESFLQDDKIRKDIAAFLTVTSAILITVSTSGDFQRKWQANRTAAAEIEREGYDFLQHDGVQPREYLKTIGDSLMRRHMAILGGAAQRKTESNRLQIAAPNQ